MSCRLFMYTNCTFLFSVLRVDVISERVYDYAKNVYEEYRHWYCNVLTSIRWVRLILKITSSSRHIVLKIFRSAAILKLLMRFSPFPSPTEICRPRPCLQNLVQIDQTVWPLSRRGSGHSWEVRNRLATQKTVLELRLNSKALISFYFSYPHTNTLNKNFPVIGLPRFPRLSHEN